MTLEGMGERVGERPGEKVGPAARVREGSTVVPWEMRGEVGREVEREVEEEPVVYHTTHTADTQSRTETCV